MVGGAWGGVGFLAGEHEKYSCSALCGGRTDARSERSRSDSVEIAWPAQNAP